MPALLFEAKYNRTADDYKILYVQNMNNRYNISLNIEEIKYNIRVFYNGKYYRSDEVIQGGDIVRVSL